MVQAYIERFNKEAIKVASLSDQEHIQAYKHGLRSLSLTKVLATKRLLSVDDLLDIVYEFIKGEISMQSKQDHLEIDQEIVKEKGRSTQMQGDRQCRSDHLIQHIGHTYHQDPGTPKTSATILPHLSLPI